MLKQLNKMKGDVTKWRNDIEIMVRIMDIQAYHIKLKYHFQFKSNNHNQKYSIIKIGIKIKQYMNIVYGINMELIWFTISQCKQINLILTKHAKSKKLWENTNKKLHSDQVFF